MRNDRWSNDREIKAALENSTSERRCGGPVLFCKNGINYVYCGEGHTLILGVSGSGKSRRLTMPLIRTYIEAGESFVVIDPKGEIYRETAGLIPEGAVKKVLNFRDILNSDGFNPLSYILENYKSNDPAKKQYAMEMVDDLAFALYPKEAKDPFWDNAAKSLFLGVTLALFDLAPASMVTLADVANIINLSEARGSIGGQDNILRKMYSKLDANSVAAMHLKGYIDNAASETRAGIRATAIEGVLKYIRSDGVINMLSTDDIKVGELDGETQTCIYIIIPDETPIYNDVAAIAVSQIANHYIRIAHEKYKGKLPVRTNICLEELGNIGKAIAKLPHLMSAGRSRNIRIQLVLQSLAQLDDIYGKANASTILDNADVTVAFRTNNWNTLQELSNKCGERFISRGGTVVREPLIAPAELGAMKTGQALVIVSGKTKFITNLPDYRMMFDFSNWHEPAAPVGVRRTEPHEFFNIDDCLSGRYQSPSFESENGSAKDADDRNSRTIKIVSLKLNAAFRKNTDAYVIKLSRLLKIDNKMSIFAQLVDLPCKFVFASREDADLAAKILIEAGFVIERP